MLSRAPRASVVPWRMPRVLLLMGSATYRARAFLEAAKSLDVDAVVGTNGDLAFAAANPEGLLPLDLANPPAASRTAADYHAGRPLAAVLACDDDGVRAAAAIAE